MYQHILFDLDGTLTDPKVGITSAVAHALKFYGIEVENLDTLCKFIGPPLADSFMEYYGFDREQAVEAVEKYREYFSVRGLYENEVYLATSKPEVYARQILEYFHLTEYFTFIGGSELSGERVRKGDVIAYVLEHEKITDRDKVIMVGDRMHDVLGAKEQNIPCIGVLYGYGNRQELEEAGATMIKESVEELHDTLV